MTDPYTPSLEDVADSWRRGRVWQLGSAVGVRSEFDRFIAQVRAETLREAAEDLAQNWTTYTVGLQTHPVGIATVSPKGYPTTGKALSVVLRSRADRIEREGS